MGFLGVYTALYDYQPQGDNELEIQEGELLYILEKSTDDDWWKAKKRAGEDDEDEPVGLIPSNYVEEVSNIPFRETLTCPTMQRTLLYDGGRLCNHEPLAIHQSLSFEKNVSTAADRLCPLGATRPLCQSSLRLFAPNRRGGLLL